MAIAALAVRASTGVPDTAEHSNHGLPRVALFVDEGNLDALLVAGLSQVQILSRADLPGMTAERLLAGGNLALIGADVAVVVERTGDRGVVRIIDCPSGATIVALDLPKMPVEETARWIVTRAQPLLGSTADVSRPRISLPGLRFVTDSAVNRSEERALNLMLTARLQARGAVVLERWRMGDLVFEKTLGDHESPFWSAAKIIAGSVSSGGGRLHARVRVRDAEGVEIFIAADGATLGSLADAIVERVLAGSGKVEVATTKETEADAFLAEAQWMLKHGLEREAWQATEAAMALGVGNKRKAEMLRIQAAAMCAYPDDLKNVMMRDGYYNAKAFVPSELPMRLAAATEAVLLAKDYWNAYKTDAPPTSGSLEEPAVLGVRSLYTGLRVLRIAIETEGNANANAVRDLGEAIRGNIALFRNASLGRERYQLFINLTNYAGYWNETPAEAIAFYRTVLASDFDADLASWPITIRKELTYSNHDYRGTIPRPPILAETDGQNNVPTRVGAWRVPNPGETASRAAWAAFLDELEHSPDVLHQADALALRWQSTVDKNGRLALTDHIANFISEHTDALYGPNGYAILCELTDRLHAIGGTRELAGAQQKIVDVFLSMIRSEPAILSIIFFNIDMPFLSGNITGSEDQGRALLAALAERRARPSTPKDEFPSIDFARAKIWKRFPELRPKVNMEDAILARSCWIAAEHAPDELRRYVGFDRDAAVWHDGHLWVLDHHKGGLWKIDPQSGDASILIPDNWPRKTYEGTGSHIVFNDYQLVAWGTQFAIAAEEGVLVLDGARKRWRTVDLPRARYRIGVAGDDLWVVSGERTRGGRVKTTEGSVLYRISPGLSCELVASSRRRPVVNPLDAILSGAPFSVSPSLSGGIVIGSRHENWGWTFVDSTSGAFPKRLNEEFLGDLRITSSPGLLIRSRHPIKNGSRLNQPKQIELIDVTKDEFLLTSPELDPSGVARFAYPKDLVGMPISKYQAAWLGGELYVLAWPSPGSPWGASEAWLVRINDSGSAVRPVRFEWSDDLERRVRAVGLSPTVFRSPRPNERGLIATDEGLVVMGSGMNGFWFIPIKDMEARRTGMEEGIGKQDQSG